MLRQLAAIWANPVKLTFERRGEGGRRCGGTLRLRRFAVAAAARPAATALPPSPSPSSSSTPQCGQASASTTARGFRSSARECAAPTFYWCCALSACSMLSLSLLSAIRSHLRCARCHPTPPMASEPTEAVECQCRWRRRAVALASLPPTGLPGGLPIGALLARLPQLRVFVRRRRA